MLARVYHRLKDIPIHLSAMEAHCTVLPSVVGGVLSLVIILIIGGSALGFTILILKIKKLKSMLEKQLVNGQRSEPMMITVGFRVP